MLALVGEGRSILLFGHFFKQFLLGQNPIHVLAFGGLS
jgi:hypothetical protein